MKSIHIFTLATSTLALSLLALPQASIEAQLVQRVKYTALGLAANWLATQASSILADQPFIAQAIDAAQPYLPQSISLQKLIPSQNKTLLEYLLKQLLVNPEYDQIYTNLYALGSKSLALFDTLNFALEEVPKMPEEKVEPVTIGDAESSQAQRALFASFCGMTGPSAPGRGTYVPETKVEPCPWLQSDFWLGERKKLIGQGIVAALSGYFLKLASLGLAQKITTGLSVSSPIGNTIAFIVVNAVWNGILSQIIGQTQTEFLKKMRNLGTQIGEASENLQLIS